MAIGGAKLLLNARMLSTGMIVACISYGSMYRIREMPAATCEVVMDYVMLPPLAQTSPKI